VSQLRSRNSNSTLELRPKQRLNGQIYRTNKHKKQNKNNTINTTNSPTQTNNTEFIVELDETDAILYLNEPIMTSCYNTNCTNTDTQAETKQNSITSNNDTFQYTGPPQAAPTFQQDPLEAFCFIQRPVNLRSTKPTRGHSNFIRPRSNKVPIRISY
jgi:hypothetical protein